MISDYPGGHEAENEPRQWDESLTGREVGDFVIQEQIDGGAYGVIYRARQKTLSREVVVKASRWRGSDKDKSTRRFLREAQLASSLDHPYAAHVYAFGAEPDGLLWIAMELVRGTPLDVLLSTQGSLPLARFEPLFAKICEVVYTAHQQGMVHRDIKPSNVMILARAGQLLPKLLDFGIAGLVAPARAPAARDGRERSLARAMAAENVQFAELPADGAVSAGVIPAVGLDGAGTLTPTGNEAFVGSPPYMAPEQWLSAARTDARTDQYALGILAYRAIAGRLPFASHSPSMLAQAHLSNPVPPMGGKFPPQLDEVMARALAKDPDDRYDNVLELAKALRAAAGLEIEPPPKSLLEARLRDAVLAKAPQPLADSVALLEVARSPQLAVQAALQVVRVAARLSGVVAVAAACRIGIDGEEMAPVRDALRRLYREELTTIEWLELTRTLVEPFADKPDAHPIPELVIRFATPPGETGQRASSMQGIIDDLVAMGALRRPTYVAESLDRSAREALERLLPPISRLIDDLSFLNTYPMVARSGEHVEICMGARRASRAQATQASDEIGEGEVALTGPFGEILLVLSPFCQSLSPAPGTPEEIFLFDGPSRFGAKLVAFPVGFERHDGELWSWFEDNVTELQLADGGEDESDRDVRPPYMGLSAFSPEDADNYFGREREVEACVNRLRVQPLLAVVGPSGAGKSSFVQAGIIPVLQDQWRAITMRPGPSPLLELQNRLDREGCKPGDLRVRLRDDARTLGQILRQRAAVSGQTVLLIVDQFEELLTLCHDLDEQQLFSEALIRACPHADNPVRIIVTLRDDFLVRAQRLPALHERLSHSLHLLGTPAPSELERILCEPAKRLGYQFEDDELPKEMIEEVADEPGALALLSFTASKLWETRDRKRRVMPRSAYESLGGVGGALAQHAEETLAAMTGEQEGLVREVFRQLVTADGTRAVLTRNELGEILGGSRRAEGALEALIGARLLVASEDENEADRVEVVHEALLSSWPRLMQWQREDAESARMRDQLRAATRQWVERGRPRGLLWRGDALMEYRVWRSRYRGSLTGAEEAFSRACVRDDARGRRLRRGLLAAAFVILVAGLLVVLQLNATSHRRMLDSYQEQGRQAWLAGDPLRAFVYLAAARREGADNPALGFLLARVSQTLEDQLLVLEDGHDDWVYVARFSPDGTLLATASRDGTAKTWDSRTGAPLATLEGNNIEIWPLQFSPDGSRLVTASKDHFANVWNARTGELLWTARHKQRVSWSGFSSDGSRVVSVGHDRTARVWNADTGELVRIIESPIGKIHAATLSPRGTHLVTAGDENIRIWNSDTGEMLFAGEGLGELALALAISPDGALLATGSHGGLARVISIATGEIRVLPGHTATIRTVNFSPDSKRVVTASEDRTASVSDAITGQVLFTLEGHTGGLTHAEFSPDGNQIATVSRDGTAKLWDASTGLLVWTFFGHNDGLWWGDFDETGHRLVTTGQDGSVRVWKADRAMHELELPAQPHEVWHAIVSPDDTRIATVLDNGTIQIWSRRGELMKELISNEPLPTPYQPRLDWSPDGRRLLASGRARATVWDVGTGKQLGWFGDHGKRTTHAVYAPDGSRIATVGEDGTVKLWDPKQSDPMVTLEGHGDVVTFADYDSSGRRLVTASYDRTARIWDTTTNTLLRTLPKQKQKVVTARFSKDGTHIVTTGRDKNVAIWTDEGERITLLEGHSAGVSSALLSFDNRLAATAGDDGTIKVWEAESGRTLWSIALESAWARSVELAGEGQLLVAATGNTAKIWRFTRDGRTAEQLANFARCRVNYSLERGSPKRIKLDYQVCTER